MINLEKIIEYFDLFSKKELDKLSKLFSDNISLKDWNINVSGKENVINAYKNIFDNVEEIRAQLVNNYEYGHTICCEILIIIYKNGIKIEEIEVMDVITFDDFMKIKSIKAYKI
jgi:hypothetical protein